jgi:hypothetical protein
MAMTAQQKSQAQAMGLNQQQIDQLTAAGFDWQKFLQALPQLIAIVLSLFAQPTPAPTPPGPVPAQS